MYNQKQTKTEPFNAQWLIYTPPGVKKKKSTFRPHSVFVCYVQTSEQVLFPYIPLTDWSL